MSLLFLRKLCSEGKLTTIIIIKFKRVRLAAEDKIKNSSRSTLLTTSCPSRVERRRSSNKRYLTARTPLPLRSKRRRGLSNCQAIHLASKQMRLPKLISTCLRWIRALMRITKRLSPIRLGLIRLALLGISEVMKARTRRLRIRALTQR